MKLPRVRFSSTACRLGIGLVILPSLLLKADISTGGNTLKSPLPGNWNNISVTSSGVYSGFTLTGEQTGYTDISEPAAAVKSFRSL